MIFRKKQKEHDSALGEAYLAVYGQRQDAYGHPLDDFSRTAKIWSAIFGHEVTAEQVALCLIGVKMSREVNRPGWDNVVDMAGYAETLALVRQERKKREGR